MEYEDMTVAQLKELLREADLPVSGNKSVLIEIDVYSKMEFT